MKKHLLLALLLSWPALASAQTAPRLADQFCVLVSEHRAKDRCEMRLITGIDPAKTGQAEEVQQVAKLEREADALSYLSSHGWEIISINAMTSSGGSYGSRFYLRRPHY